MALLLALDQGTTSSRALVFDDSGAVVALAQQEFEQHYPQPGWVEHDPHAILDTQLAVAAEAVSRTRGEITAIGITNQRETCVLWERSNGRACAPAIVWQDLRTAGTCADLRAAGHTEEVRRRTGLPIDPYFSASKIAWLLDSDPALRRRAERGELACGTIDSWLVWHLTGGAAHITDATNASRTLLYNLHEQCWDETLLELWRIPPALLPTVVDSSGVVATSRQFGRELPIAGIAGDQQAALFGQACLSPGMLKCTYGTGCFALMHTGHAAPQSSHGLITTIASRINGETDYALEGSVFMGGATVQWLRDGLNIIERAGDVEALAASVPDTGGVALVPAFTGLGAPHWDSEARALLIGMTRGTSRAHIARAALEGIAWQVSDVIHAMAADAAIEMHELRVDGGASRNALLMQMQSDQLGLPLVAPAIAESTAYGAALLAGLGAGVIPDRDAITAGWGAARRFTPKIDAAERAQRAKSWHRALARARGWAATDQDNRP